MSEIIFKNKKIYIILKHLKKNTLKNNYYHAFKHP